MMIWPQPPSFWPRGFLSWPAAPRLLNDDELDKAELSLLRSIQVPDNLGAEPQPTTPGGPAHLSLAAGLVIPAEQGTGQQEVIEPGIPVPANWEEDMEPPTTGAPAHLPPATGLAAPAAEEGPKQAAEADSEKGNDDDSASGAATPSRDRKAQQRAHKKANAARARAARAEAERLAQARALAENKAFASEQERAERLRHAAALQRKRAHAARLVKQAEGAEGAAPTPAAPTPAAGASGGGQAGEAEEGASDAHDIVLSIIRDAEQRRSDKQAAAAAAAAAAARKVARRERRLAQAARRGAYECIVCFEPAPPFFVARPCGHAACCRGCIDSIRSAARPCAYCGADVAAYELDDAPKVRAAAIYV